MLISGRLESGWNAGEDIIARLNHDYVLVMMNKKDWMRCVKKIKKLSKKGGWVNVSVDDTGRNVSFDEVRRITT